MVIIQSEMCLSVCVCVCVCVLKNIQIKEKKNKKEIFSVFVILDCISLKIIDQFFF